MQLRLHLDIVYRLHRQLNFGMEALLNKSSPPKNAKTLHFQISYLSCLSVFKKLVLGTLGLIGTSGGVAVVAVQAVDWQRR